MNLPTTSIQLWSNLFELKSRDLIIERVFQQLSNDLTLAGHTIPEFLHPANLPLKNGPFN